MKKLLLITALGCALAGAAHAAAEAEKMTISGAIQVLLDAEQARQEGRFEQALNGYIWIDQNAHKVAPELSFVQRYAFSHWAELGRQHAPALSALQTLRASQAALLLGGSDSYPDDVTPNPLSRSRYGTVKAIDHYLGEEGATYRLFLELVQSQPAIAARHARSMLPMLLENGDFALAQTYVPDPAARLRQSAGNVNRSGELPASESGQLFMQIQAEASNFAAESRQMVALLRGLNRDAEAAALEKESLSLLKSKAVRELVRQDIERPGTIIEQQVARQMAADDATGRR